jgi:hypothetical protein
MFKNCTYCPIIIAHKIKISGISTFSELARLYIPELCTAVLQPRQSYVCMLTLKFFLRIGLWGLECQNTSFESLNEGERSFCCLYGKAPVSPQEPSGRKIAQAEAKADNTYIYVSQVQVTSTPYPTLSTPCRH